jgi:hypothetical protein
MHARIRLSLIAGTTLLALSAPVSAFNCYAIVDRNNDVVYQGVFSPVDLSDEGAPARAAMRARGQQLIAMDTENCPAIDRARVTGQGGPATVEEIVAGMRSAVSYGSVVQPSRDETVTSGGISLPRITVPRAAGGGISPSGPPSGMSIR